jgi:Sulfatase-modifying factor enzyme 1/TIR domain
MSDAFISYRRKPSAALAQLIQVQLKNRHGIEAYVDVTRLDGNTVPFPDQLMKAIEDAPTFICLLGEGTLDSKWVGDEIQRAYELGKPCIPVFQESYIPPTDPEPAINYLLNFDGVHVFDIKNVLVEESIAKIAGSVVKRRSFYWLYLIAGLITGATVITTRKVGLPKLTEARAIIIAALITGAAAIIAAYIALDVNNNQTVVPTQAEIVQQATTEEPSRTPTIQSSQAPNQTPTDTPSEIPTDEPSHTPTDISTETPTNEPTPDFGATAAVLAATYNMGTESARQTEIAASWTDTPTITPSPTITHTPSDTATETPTITPSLTATYTPTLTSTSSYTPTNTNTPTFTPSATFLPGFEPVAHNTDWTSIEQTFGRVTMVLVPAGCFMMGSNDGEANERPIEQQCFGEPFWIDKYEVSNNQFGESGTYSGNQNPRETISWFGARNHCRARGARLPTEAEWEYAARGPDSLTYPWGNGFDGNMVVYKDNTSSPLAVGSKSQNASWVGALDMSGNVWEWVSGFFWDYPYKIDDRELDSDSSQPRTIRGGSWGNVPFELRSSYRYGLDPYQQSNYGGFRCARDY